MIPRLELIGALKDAQLLDESYDAPTLRYRNEQLAVSVEGNLIKIAIAGSNDLVDWIQNLTAWRPWIFQKRIPGTKWKATKGYVKAAKNICEAVEPRLNKRDPVRFIGHSAGGPKSCIVSLMLKQQGYNIQPPRTFASPRWSTHTIKSGLIKSSSRYVADGDVVPDYPQPNDWRPWQHFGNKYAIGTPVDEHIGVIRDGVKTHLLPHYINSLEKEING